MANEIENHVLRGGIDFERLEATCRRRGNRAGSTEVAAKMIAAFHAPALSRKVLDLDDDWPGMDSPPSDGKA